MTPLFTQRRVSAGAGQKGGGLRQLLHRGRLTYNKYKKQEAYWTALPVRQYLYHGFYPPNGPKNTESLEVFAKKASFS